MQIWNNIGKDFLKYRLVWYFAEVPILLSHSYRDLNDVTLNSLQQIRTTEKKVLQTVLRLQKVTV